MHPTLPSKELSVAGLVPHLACLTCRLASVQRGQFTPLPWLENQDQLPSTAIQDIRIRVHSKHYTTESTELILFEHRYRYSNLDVEFVRYHAAIEPFLGAIVDSAADCHDLGAPIPPTERLTMRGTST